MTKPLSRTIHVTVTVAVDVPVSEARTVKDAILYAEQIVDVRNGNVFDSKGVLFDTWSESDQEKHERREFIKKWRNND